MFWLAYPSYSYAFRLIIEVDTPSGPKLAYSVIGFTWRKQVATGPHGALAQIKGNAVFLDLGNGRNLVATLGFGPHGNNGRLEYLAFEAFKRAGRPMDMPTLAKARGSVPLTGDLVPTLVTFGDVNEPKSARVVSPQELPAVFGPGFRFRGARIEMTNDRITRRIEKELPFLVPMQEAQRGREAQRVFRIASTLFHLYSSRADP